MFSSFRKVRERVRVLCRGGAAALLAASVVIGGVSAATASDVQASVVQQESVQQIPVGVNPTDVALDRVLRQAYVISEDGVVSVLESDGLVAAAIPLKKKLLAVAVNSSTHRVYVSDDSGVVTVIDGTKNVAVATIDVDLDPLGIDVDEVGNKIYVADQRGVRVINGETNVIEATVARGIGMYPNGIAVDAERELVYVTSVDPSEAFATVDVIDLRLKRVMEKIVLPDSVPDLGDVVIDKVNNKIYVANSSPLLYVIDGETFGIAKRIRVCDWTRDLAFDQDAGMIYATSSDGIVTVVGAGDRVVDEFELDGGPRGVAVAPGSNKLYVTNYWFAAVTVLDI